MAFDVITPTQMGVAELTTGIATIRTTPASSRDIIKQIDLANNNPLAASVSVHLVPDGGSADATNILLPAVSIPANTALSWSGVQVMHEGGTVQAQSTVSDVSIVISGGNAA